MASAKRLLPLYWLSKNQRNILAYIILFVINLFIFNNTIICVHKTAPLLSHGSLKDNIVMYSDIKSLQFGMKHMNKLMDRGKKEAIAHPLRFISLQI